MKIPAAIALAATLAGIARADTIRLRNGTELEGTVISETADAYVALIQVTATIRDERTIPKSDVLEIVAVKKDEIRYEEIKSLVPTPDLLTVPNYEDRLAKVHAFLKEFPDSPLKGKVEAMAKTLAEEADAIEAGGIKFQGKIVPAESRAASAYTLDSEIAASKFTDMVEKRQLIPALRAWDELATGFPNSKAFLDNVPLAIRTLNTLAGQIDASLATFDEREQKRSSDLAAMSPSERARSAAALKDKADAYLTKVEQEKEDKQRWLSLDPEHKEPMTSVRSTIDQEARRLEALDTSITPVDEAWADAWQTMHAKPTAEEARAAIQKARTSGVTEPYLKKLEKFAPAR